MATQQVKFHSVSEAQYKTATKSDGSLYFITDNGEIRKGESHITGTRVYTAVDPTNGATPLANLTILLNGSAPGANDQPKKGDILVVDQTLKAGVPASGTEGQEGYVPAVPAVIAKAAYAHNGTDWEACDGNVDASKVILTQDYRLAGDYDKVGNIKKSDGQVSSNGKSVAQLFQEIFLKRLQPGNQTQPSVTLNINNQNANYSTSAEVGSTVNIPNYSATFSGGAYTYNATGITASGWSVTETKGNTTQTTSTGSLPSVVADDTAQTYTVTATATYGAGATPTDNLGDPATNQSAIAAGSKSASHTVTVTGYRKSFYIVLPPEFPIDTSNPNFLSGNYQIPGTPVTLDSDTIREQNGIAHSVIDSDANLSSISITKYDADTNPTGEGPFLNILVFRPATGNQNKKLLASTAKGLPYIKEPGAYPINGTISIDGANDIKPTDYCCWVISSGTAPVDNDTVSLSWV